MFYVALNFCGKILKNVNVLEKNARAFLCNKTFMATFYVLAGRLRIHPRGWGWAHSCSLLLCYELLKARVGLSEKDSFIV